MEEKNFGMLGQMFQLSLLKLIIEDKKFSEQIIGVIEYKYFENNTFRYLITNIKELYEKYNTIPGYETLTNKILTEATSKEETTTKMHIDTVNNIKDHKVENEPFIKDQALNFCKQQVLKESIKKVEAIMSNGDFEEYEKIEEIIREALQVGTITNDDICVFDDIRKALEQDNRTPFPTGITGLDNLLRGGLARGELGIVLAPTGVGKTTVLTKFGNTAYNHGANVLQIVFEDNKNAIMRKHYAIWSGISPHLQSEHVEEIVPIIEERKANSNGKLIISKMPSFGTTLGTIKSKIRKYINDGIKIDLLIIDYVDCINSDNKNYNEEWKGEGNIMRGIESMAEEFDMAIWVATQGDRSSIATEVVQMHQMGGSIKKAQIGHVVLTVGKTLEQKENKLATMTLVKSRIGGDGVVWQNCKFDNELLIIDTEEQNTLLGHREDQQARRINRIQEVYRNSPEFRENAITNFNDGEIGEQ
jgi:replicative DNA helicase